MTHGLTRLRTWKDVQFLGPLCEPLLDFCSRWGARRSSALEGDGPLQRANRNSEFLNPRAREGFTFLLDQGSERAGISRSEAPWLVEIRLR